MANRISSTVAKKLRRADFWGAVIIWALSIAIWLSIAFIGYVTIAYT